MSWRSEVRGARRHAVTGGLQECSQTEGIRPRFIEPEARSDVVFPLRENILFVRVLVRILVGVEEAHKTTGFDIVEDATRNGYSIFLQSHLACP